MSSDADRMLHHLREEKEENEKLIRLIETQKEEIVGLRQQRAMLIEEVQTRDKEIDKMVREARAGDPTASTALRGEIAYLSTVRNSQADRIRKQSDELSRLRGEMERQRQGLIDLRRVQKSLSAECQEKSQIIDEQARKLKAFEAGRQLGKSGVTRHQVASIIEACAQRVRDTKIAIVGPGDPDPFGGKERSFIVIDEAGPYPEGLL